MAALDLNDIKEQIQSILQDANTTTASTPLSGNLTTGHEVKAVLKVNPSLINVQASLHSFVSVFVDKKDIEMQSMAKDMNAAKRMATVNMKIIGAVYNTNFISFDEDPADEDIENLMENVEQILRDSHTLNNTVLYSFPTGVDYHDEAVDDQSHLRAGIMDLEVKLNY